MVQAKNVLLDWKKNTARTATLPGRLHCPDGHTVWTATLPGRLHCPDGHTARVATLPERPHCPRQSPDSVQFLSNYQCIFHSTRTKHFKICMEASTRILLLCIVKVILREKSRPGSLTSDYTAKLRSSTQCGAGTKAVSMGRDRNKPTTLVS